MLPANITGLEYLNVLYKGSNPLLNFLSLIAFFGGRYVISDFYDNRKDILCNIFVKILMLFSIIYINIKNLKLSIIIFFIYIFFLDNLVQDACHDEYFNNENTENTENTNEIEIENENNLNQINSIIFDVNNQI